MQQQTVESPRIKPVRVNNASKNQAPSFPQKYADSVSKFYINI